MSENPYQAPHQLDGVLPGEIEDIAVTNLVKAASFTTLGVGFLTVAAGAQMKFGFTIYGWFVYVPYIFFVLSPFGFILAKKLFQMKYWGAVGGLIYGIITAVLVTIWVLFSIGAGLLLPLHGIIPIVATSAAVLCGLSLNKCRTAENARQYYKEQGLDINF